MPFNFVLTLFKRSLKDIINPYYNCLLKNANFSIKISNVVLNGIICFSVRFCDNSLLVLKMRFQVFSVASKKVQRFSSDRKIFNVVVISAPSSTKLCQFSEILNFSQDIWGNVDYVPEIDIIS